MSGSSSTFARLVSIADVLRGQEGWPRQGLLQASFSEAKDCPGRGVGQSSVHWLRQGFPSGVSVCWDPHPPLRAEPCPGQQRGEGVDATVTPRGSPEPIWTYTVGNPMKKSTRAPRRSSGQRPGDATHSLEQGGRLQGTGAGAACRRPGVRHRTRRESAGEGQAPGGPGLGGSGLRQAPRARWRVRWHCSL